MELGFFLKAYRMVWQPRYLYNLDFLSMKLDGRTLHFFKDEDDDGLLGVEARGMFYVDPLRIAVGCLSL